MRKVELNANAKINLFLEITGKRKNGYHDISTVMHTVALCDKVSVSNSSSKEITITSNSNSMPTDRRNIAYRCAEEFFTTLNHFDGVEIYIEKHIPMEAGLAGGSADGAAVLNALNELYSLPFSKEKLCEIGKKIGADIPFCIMGGTMLAEGIGDILTSCSPLPDCIILIAKGKNGVSTGDAYNKLDSIQSRKIRTNKMPVLLSKGDIFSICKGMYNCFEQLVPEIESIKKIMIANGALNAMMSGSGSAVFGVYTDMTDAQRSASILRERGIFSHIC